MLTRKVEDMDVHPGTSVKELMDDFRSSGGFVAKKVAVAHDILRAMFDSEGVNFFSFPACIVSTGTRGVISKAVRKGLFDVLITTCGTLDHDLARVWEDYYHGDFDADDTMLHREGINRLGNIFIPNSSYGEVLEANLQPLLEEIIGDSSIGPRELIHQVGLRIKDKNSILHWAAKNDIPVYVPGITDGAFGSQLWMYWQGHRNFRLDLMKDQQELADIVFPAKETGALMIGGGISKHHTIWWNQYRGGLDRTVYITTAVEYDGSLSGARVSEAISWGKVRTGSDYITVEGDATVLLPLVLGSFL